MIKNLEFEIVTDAFISLVGPSGAGKSTLLNILSGLDGNFDGSLEWVDGGPGCVSYVFQDPRLMPWLTVRENVELVMNDAKKDSSWVDHLLHLVELDERADAFPGQLSGGMQRRVALARAMAIKPDILLLDEPFSSLDAPTAASLREMVLDLWRDHSSAVILVTHNLNEALELADQILFLSKGPASIIHQEALQPSRIDPTVERDSDNLAKALLKRQPGILSGVAVDQIDQAQAAKER
ncbi:MAG: ABC transporter ATP-binding protein [Candidatus Thiodiazotropha sp. (ex Lucina aurantia)]|uniref:ABC transporter ATP-binding protein n=1 Tax=Candidatus Thiodiazotropha taylori TaxID=2792791 RepID=A0A9E4TVN8_9GAMM|nr:ABC transporter ATP-binding protein [Candidatus Thiodiazotropha endolucinida]MBT3013613.1 ABC transporter ATP-binding protein [Candidatus Thiodiazotropha sp. (ex Lucina pensylvanica)]MBT3016058.1 ABC transporter ATP-binding protein [Candidatus Thiodiazotropha taylori]MBT3038659.1 ABC transporter ATP-binding protein [Candidatus Thiodiazotropha sp. (ex Codakia orbicularis)]MBV2102635.1 ABC transporter ATP-binding protein [Candidatus Thiodiazotropha sp. (ex Lucina aurantia)]MBT3023035.1 ABC tr